jgi:hypothetical protein
MDEETAAFLFIVIQGPEECENVILMTKITQLQRFLPQEGMSDHVCTMNGKIQNNFTSAVPSSSQTLAMEPPERHTW